MVHNISIVHRGEYKILSVKYKYTKGIRGVHTYPNGDPGYPDEEPELELLQVFYRQRKIIRYLSLQGLEGIANEVWKQYN